MKPEGGWIKLYRQLTLNNIWTDEPFSRGQAWIDLLLLANHKDGIVRVRGIKIPILRGQVGWSELKLADRWKWSRGKVRRFICELENEKMVVQQKNRKTSIISILNYEFYQCNDTTDSTTDGQQIVQQTDTNKNEKNEKNESRSVSNRTFVPPSLEEVSDYCNERKNNVNPQKWHDFYSAKGWMVGKNKMKDWKAAVRTWEETKPKPQETGMGRLKRIARGEKVD
jgi:hypothetical protein